ncbi:sugar porter family MFS transporter [Chitinophagaceae bacterium LB-8]|uniref:Sugar porter family MFS transporter n=1 Tax=Paraflavisolibacter caeni TaxID=2982496 RepID=A0A9X2XNH9_9BACT|nr:sugar porter family MFS transporter [Paraflavisolibacter caeni]MCU7548803.1 sugar porter family MFS transporter [Paraflavisolibacter caeni]
MQNTSSVNTRFLALITITATLGGFLFGFDTAVISGTIASVKQQYNLSALMEGWYVSSALLGSIAGVAISGWLGDRWGRKKVMLLSALLFGISAIGCAFAPDAFFLIVFRLIGGLGIGVASVICPMYIAELAPSHIRGKLVTYYQLAITIGILLAYFSNATIQSYAHNSSNSHIDWQQLLFHQEFWRGMFAAGIIPALIFVVMIAFIPESPRWLAMKKRTDEAKQVLTKILNAQQANTEINGIQASLQSETTETNKWSVFNGNMKKPIFIGILLAALSQFSGINAIIYYGPSILEKAGFQLGEALGGQVTIGIVNTLFTFVAIYMIDKKGRKPLLQWGIGGAVLSLLLAALFFALNITSQLVLVPIVLFIACFAFSFGPVTWVVITEIFPTKMRGEAVAISTISLWIANWVVGQFFPLMLHNVGASITFLVFALFSLYAFYLSWKKIPETKGKTLEEIELFWKNNK